MKHTALRDSFLCKIDGCNRPYHAYGYCKTHYLRARRNGEFSRSKCVTPGCTNRAEGAALCRLCRDRKYRKNNKEKIDSYREVYRGKNYKKLNSNARKYYVENKERLRPIRQAYRENNKETLAAWNREFNRVHSREMNKKALLIYGLKCQVCGCLDIRLLHFHHRKRTKTRDGNGAITRRIISSGKQDKNIMLVCANCHIKQNLIDGTSRNGLRTKRAATGTWLERPDKPLIAALNIYGCKCHNCGNKDPVILQWHHRIPRVPRECSSAMFIRIRDNGKPVHDILLLCANCHIIFDGQDKTCNRLRSAA